MLTTTNKPFINNIIYSILFIFGIAISGISYSACVVPDGVIGKNGEQLTQTKIDKIISKEKGARSKPEEYLDGEYIRCHLNSFSNGASRLVKKEVHDKYGVGKPDGEKTEFVSTKENIDQILRDTEGDRVAIAKRLGLYDETFSGDIVRIDFIPTEKYVPAIPSGNEFGANDKWISGGSYQTASLKQ